MSGDDSSRSTLFNERRKHLRKRKKWIQNLSIISSEEDTSDECRPDIKIDTSQLIALRFPYPMISDDSDDEEDLKYFPVDLNSCLSTNKKRKHLSSLDEDSNLTHKNKKHFSSSDEDSNLTRKQKKKKFSKCKNQKKINKDLHNYESPNVQDSVKSTSWLRNSKITHSFTDEKQTKHNGYRKRTKSSDIVMISISSSDSSDETSKRHEKKRKGNHIKNGGTSKMASSVNCEFKNCQPSFRSKHRSPAKNLSHCKTVQTSHSTTESVKSTAVEILNQTVNKKAKSNSELIKAKKSRFLDSSSENPDEEDNDKKILLKTKSNSSSRFRRLHVMSPSSSDSDRTVLNEIQHDSKKPLSLSLNKSVKSKTRKRMVNHFISSSSEEETDEDLVTTKNMSINQELPHTTPKDIHPCYNLIQNFNSAKPQQLENKDEKVENILENNTCKSTTVSVTSNPSTAWKNIAAMPDKQNTSSLKKINKVKINDLKKKYASSNVPAVEIQKKIHNMASKENGKSKPSSFGIKNLKNKGSCGSLSDSKDIYNENSNTVQVQNNLTLNETKNGVQSNSERRQPLENKYTVNVNVYCNSSKNSETENIRSSDNHYMQAADETLVSSEQSKLDINLMMHHNVDDVAVSEHSKKIRISRVNQGTIRSLQKNKPPIYNNKSQQIKKTIETVKTHENESKEIKNKSSKCDVLGSILSEMENNPYKIEKPIKKAADMLGWSPNPLIFGINKQNCIPETNSSITAPCGLQSEMVNASLNKNGTVKLSTFTPNNSYLTPPSKLELAENSGTSSNNIKAHEKCLERNNTRQSVIVQFYSADSQEYKNKSTEKVHFHQEAQRSLEDGKLCKTRTPPNKVSVNEKEKEAIVKLANEKEETLSTEKLMSNHKHPLESKKLAHFTDKSSLTGSFVDNKVKMQTNTKSLPSAINKAAEKIHCDQKKIHQTSLEEGKLCKTQTASNKVSINEEYKQTNIKQNNPKEETVSNKKLLSNHKIPIENSHKNIAGLTNKSSLTGSSVNDEVKIQTNIKSMPAANKKAATRTDNVQVEKKDVDNGNTTGIRIKLGGTIFRLPGKVNSSTTNNVLSKENSTISSSNKKEVISSRNKKLNSSTDSTDSNTFIRPISNPNLSSSLTLSKDPDSSSSDSSETSSDSSDDSDSSSSESSDSSESGNNQEEECLTKEVTSVASNQQFTIEKDPSLNESTNGLDNATMLNDGDTIKTSKCQSNSNDNEIIVLSDSSDSENNIGNNDASKLNVIDKIDHPEDNLASKSMVKSNDSNSNFIGKIRVRSLRDLGVDVEKSLPENALPTVPMAVSPVVTSGQPNVQHSMPEITKNPFHSDSGQTEFVQNSNSNLSLPVKSNNHLNTHIESTQNSDAPQSSKPPAFNESIPNVSQSQDSVIQTDNSSNASTVPKETETVIEKLPVVQALPNQTNENVSAQPSLSETEKLFFGLCDQLFTDVVNLKFPKLVDDLHLSILHDRIKEERLKKLDQLISPETIASEKHRAEKDFAEMIKIRSQSFVPLLITIVKKITKNNFITLVTALYCRIVHQLERIEPENSEYRFKLKDIIKFMLQKHSSPEIEELISVFSSDENTFTSHFNFVDVLLHKYYIVLEERQRQAQQYQNVTINNPGLNVSERQRQVQQNQNVTINDPSLNVSEECQKQAKQNHNVTVRNSSAKVSEECQKQAQQNQNVTVHNSSVNVSEECQKQAQQNQNVTVHNSSVNVSEECQKQAQQNQNVTVHNSSVNVSEECQKQAHQKQNVSYFSYRNRQSLPLPISNSSNGTLILAVLQTTDAKAKPVNLPRSETNLVLQPLPSTSNSSNTTSPSPAPPNSLIGNLDSILFKTPIVKKTSR